MSMKFLDKEKGLLLGLATVLLAGLFFGGRTTPNPTSENPSATGPETRKGFDIQHFIEDSKKNLSSGQSAQVLAMENAITRGDLATQRIAIYKDLADFWRDSASNTIAFLWFTGERAKLENSEKNLNFAAHSYLTELRGTSDPELKSWMAVQARELFKASLALHPQNDSTRVGLGSTYFFGLGAGDSPMEGISKIREVADRDSSNMFAQFMLGYGGMVSGQYEKAAERFEKVLRNEPENTEAVFLMAEACERSGNNTKAVYWYRVGKKNVRNPDVIRAIDDKIKSLQ